MLVDLRRVVAIRPVQYLLPLLHPAPSGTWDHRGAVPVSVAGTGTARPEELARRHLAAFGPASTSDVRARSGVAGLPEIVAVMKARGELRTFRDGQGDTPARVGFAARTGPCGDGSS